MKKIILFLIMYIAFIHGMEEEIPLMTFVKPNTTENNNECNLANKNLQTIEDCYLQDISATQYAAYTTLMLHNNMLQSVPENFVALFPNLKELDISHNDMTSVDIGAYFRACPNIKKMNFSHNQINDVTWSNHKIWCIEKDDMVELPIINLVGNPITTNQNACNDLKERYCKELYQVCHKTYPFGIPQIGGCLSGISASGLLSCLLKFTVHVHSAVWFSYIPGCLIGTAAGIAYAKLDYYYKMKNRFEDIKVPMYFEENQNNYTKSVAFDNKSCGESSYLYTCYK